MLETTHLTSFLNFKNLQPDNAAICELLQHIQHINIVAVDSVLCGRMGIGQAKTEATDIGSFVYQLFITKGSQPDSIVGHFS